MKPLKYSKQRKMLLHVDIRMKTKLATWKRDKEGGLLRERWSLIGTLTGNPWKRGQNQGESWVSYQNPALDEKSNVNSGQKKGVSMQLDSAWGGDGVFIKCLMEFPREAGLCCVVDWTTELQWWQQGEHKWLRYDGCLLGSRYNVILSTNFKKVFLVLKFTTYIADAKT